MDFTEFITTIGGIIIIIIIIFGIIALVEHNESANFWECIDNKGSVDWCINQFEYDAEYHIDGFYSCMDEIKKLEYCHTKFLR